ncbi:MAG: hypothetical protein KAI18_00825 [Candidatus Aenigmarchaeota archaeon]|nr:hypothetical protein [Candidatus Aenigmarchaeota archaeon]
MSSQPTSEQESRMSEFLALDVYESTGDSYNNLISLLEKHDSSVIVNSLDNGIHLYSEVLGLDIIGNHIGSVKVNPDKEYSNPSDWYDLQLWGHIINHYNASGIIKDTPNDVAYPFLNELQYLFSPVGTAKDPRLKRETLTKYHKEKRKSLPLKVSLLPFVFFGPSYSIPLYLLTLMVINGTIKTYCDYYTPQYKPDTTELPENIIFHTFDKIYKD